MDELVKTGILSLPTLRIFYERPEHADAKEPLLAWHGHVLKSKWQTPADVKADFGTASILKDGRVVFHIAGNKLTSKATCLFIPSMSTP